MSVRWPRFLTPSHLSQLIKNQKSPLKALQIFNEAKSRYPDYHHNGPVYVTMINILGSSGRIPEMKAVIDQMKDDSCQCRDSAFANAIKTYAKAGLLGEAMSLFKNLPDFNCVNWTESFNTLLQIMVKESNNPEAAFRLFLENACGWEVKSRTRSFNLLILALCQLNRSDLALDVFQEMKYRYYYSPDRETYQILMTGLCQDGRFNEATHLLYSMFRRISQKGGGGEDVVIYRTLLNALCDDGQVQEAVEILSKVLRKGLKAPNRYFNQLDLNGFLHCADKEGAKALINEALIKGGIPSSESYRAMAVELYSEGKIDEANKVMQTMLDRGFKPQLSIYEAKVKALCRAGRVSEAAQQVIEKEMVEENCVPTVGLYNTVIKRLCFERKSALSVRYFDRISKKTGRLPDRETYTVLFDGLCRDGRYIEASRIMERMSIHLYWPDDDTFNTLVGGLCLAGRLNEAVTWLEEMVSQAKVPQLCVWNVLVTSLCSDTEVLSEMVERLRNSS